MTTLNIALTEELRAYVEAELTREGYANASEYFQALILDQRRRRARRDLDAKLLEGLQGPAVEMTPDDWASIRSEALGEAGTSGP